MENYLLVNNYGKSNTPDRIYYIMRRSDLSNLIKEESVVFGDKAYILEEGTMMFMGNDGIWYDTEGEVPVITTKELNVTENGTYADPDPYVAYRPVNVQVTDYNVEELNVVENGTYSEPGKAYSPVVVNVPLPENAYLKKDLPTGAIATVTDAEAEIMPSLKVAITPVQSGSGDPSPDNIRPISGWTGAKVTRMGKNLLQTTLTSKVERGITYTVNTDGTVSLSGTATVPYSQVIIGHISLAAGSYVISDGGIESTNIELYIGTVSGATTKLGGSFVLKEAITDKKVYFYVKSGTNMTGKVVMPMIRLASAPNPTIFAPYTGTTYPITFPSEAGTVYGGTLDVTNGTLTVTNASVDLGTLTWQTASNNKYFYSNGIVATAKKAASSDTPANMICEQYKSVSRNTLVNGSGDCEVAINTSSLLQLKDARFAEYTPSDVQTAVTGIKLVYELATPQTYQLTPTEVQMLLGTNNIWADTGDILEGKYWSKNPVTVTQAMFNTLQDAGEITEIKPEEPEEPEENDER